MYLHAHRISLWGLFGQFVRGQLFWLAACTEELEAVVPVAQRHDTVEVLVSAVADTAADLPLAAVVVDQERLAALQADCG